MNIREFIYNAAIIRQDKLNFSNSETAFNSLHPLIQVASKVSPKNGYSPDEVNLLLQPSGEHKDLPNDGYLPAKLVLNKHGKYDLQLQEYAKEENKSVMKMTKPHILRSVYSRSVTLQDRLYILHNLEYKDETLPATTTKNPVRIMDFSTMKMHKIDYLNDDSTGTQRGNEEDKKATILPLTSRINYSIASYKNKTYIYGGLNEKCEILATMELYDAQIFKFQPVKFRGDSKPVGRQGHQAVLLNQYSMVIIGGTYSEKLLPVTSNSGAGSLVSSKNIDSMAVPENDLIWSFDTESGQWQNVKVKNQGISEHSTESNAHDLVPWNLVHHTAFKVDEDNICVLWYDNFADVFGEEEGQDENKSTMMISLFNCKRCIWKNLKIASIQTKENGAPLDVKYMFGCSIYPLYCEEQDRVSKILVLGGIDLNYPDEQQGLNFMSIDLMQDVYSQHLDFEMVANSNTVKDDTPQQSQKQAPKNVKKFKEDDE